MKNMKKIFMALTSFGFVTATGMSVIACDKDPGTFKMNDTILENLGIYDKDGNSTVKTILDGSGQTIDWKFILNAKEDLTATNLLDSTKNYVAKSDDAYNYLTKTLKLKANDKKEFKKEETDKYKLEAINDGCTVNTEKTTDDYGVKDGTVNIQWVNQDQKETVLDKTTVKLAGNDKLNVNTFIKLETTDFQTDKAPFSKFQEGKPIADFGVKKDQDITEYVKTDSVNWVKDVALNKLLKQSDIKVIVTDEPKSDSGNFKKDTVLKVKVMIGELAISQDLTPLAE